MKLLTLTFISGLLLATPAAFAGDLEWSGTYRIEATKVNAAAMNDSERNKQYLLQHLILNPKITVYDGVTIHTRFDIMNSTAYPNSQVGQFFGSGVSGSGGNNPQVNVTSENEKAEFIDVNQLYLTYAHEFGVLTAGRAPIHFGLGMTYNAGNGAFDHWFDNRDMIAYKVMTGNLSFMVAAAKIAENDVSYSDDVDDYIGQVMYENPETDLKIGLLYRIRHGGRQGNDAPGATKSDPYQTNYMNFTISRYVTQSLKFGLEAGMQKGKTGVLSGASNVELDGFGAVLELDYVPKESKHNAYLKAGIASGDDPTTPLTNESFVFDRNYDVAFLLFNHPLGNFDIFRTSEIRNTANPAYDSIDEEAISNVFFISPSYRYKWSDKFDTLFGLTYARLSTDPLSGASVDKEVGFEVDATLTYKPYDGVQWVTRLGVFAPGAAFEGGNNNYTTNTVLGLETKAAITF